MRGGIIATIISLTLIGLTAAYTAVISEKTEDIILAVEQAQTDEPYEMEEAYRSFKKIEWVLSLTLSDDHLHQTEISFNECVSLIYQGEGAQAKTVKNRLMLQLVQIKRFSGLNIKSVF